MRLRRVLVEREAPSNAAARVAPSPPNPQEEVGVDQFTLRIEVVDSGAGISKENQVHRIITRVWLDVVLGRMNFVELNIPCFLFFTLC